MIKNGLILFIISKIFDSIFLFIIPYLCKCIPFYFISHHLISSYFFCALISFCITIGCFALNCSTDFDTDTDHESWITLKTYEEFLNLKISIETLTNNFGEFFFHFFLFFFFSFFFLFFFFFSFFSSTSFFFHFLASGIFYILNYMFEISIYSSHFKKIKFSYYYYLFYLNKIMLFD